MKTKLSREDCIKLYNRIIRTIKNPEVNFYIKKLKGIMGYCEWSSGITLDYRREFISTLIHECIHYIEPEWNETKVLYAEKRVVNNLTTAQIIKLLTVFVKRFNKL